MLEFHPYETGWNSIDTVTLHETCIETGLMKFWALQYNLE
jgi:hypothetical protein